MPPAFRSKNAGGVLEYVIFLEGMICMGQKKGNLMGNSYLVKPYGNKNMLYMNSSKINYVAARTELSEKIVKECVQGITGGINSMYNNIYNDLLKESGYEKTGKKFTRPEWYGK